MDALGRPVPEGPAGLPQLPDLRPTASNGLSADLDAIALFIALGIRAPISPVKDDRPRIEKGRQLFEAAGCHNCHGGKNWTASTIDYPRQRTPAR